MPGQWLSQGVLVACWRGLHLFFTFYRTHVQAIIFYHILINLFIYLFIMFLMANWSNSFFQLWLNLLTYDEENFSCYV